MEREKKCIVLYKKSIYRVVMQGAPMPLAAYAEYPQHLRNIAAHATRRYVDNLTKKQQMALVMIDMLDEGQVVEGVGCWVNSYYYGYPTKRYVIDC